MGLVGKTASQCPPPTPARAEMRAAVHASSAQVPEIPLIEQVAADYRREIEKLKREMESLKADARALAGTSQREVRVPPPEQRAVRGLRPRQSAGARRAGRQRGLCRPAAQARQNRWRTSLHLR